MSGLLLDNGDERSQSKSHCDIESGKVPQLGPQRVISPEDKDLTREPCLSQRRKGK